MALTRYAPGNFCWGELDTTDPSGAENFYARLFGWKVVKMPIGPDDSYAILQIDDKVVGAICRLTKWQSEHEIRSHWLSYISVRNADHCAKAITAAGGKLMMCPFDVFDLGRMTVARDPTGAIFAVWQPLQGAYHQFRNEKCAMCWNELVTPDPATAISFYQKVFGWRAVTRETETENYTEFYLGDPAGRAVASCRNLMNEECGDPIPHWMVYFAVDDCVTTGAKATSLGAAMGNLPAGRPDLKRAITIKDPQGALFSACSGPIHDP